MDIQNNKDVNLKIRKMNRKLIKPKQAAGILMCSERTLETWRREEKVQVITRLNKIFTD